jgi:hypothetical protein
MVACADWNSFVLGVGRVLAGRKSASEAHEADGDLRTGWWAALMAGIAAMAMLPRGAGAQSPDAAGDELVP